MAEDSPRRSLKETVKAPLIFSFALGVLAGAVTLMVTSGGSDNPDVTHAGMSLDNPLNLALIAFGIAFIASLLIVSMLQLASRENPEHLATGSGVNRNSEELYRQQVAERREKARRKKQQEARERGEQPPYGKDADPEG
ncbi:hypothetical protein [Nesterenkonia flava]|uniref:Uncharacterized protein n=1 Tax=Nesterenkonia flava TaxID=469799 RepID=A0ABU1FSB3_9MICC|nr:hypothetical protein [Nesterenkonia flava]MDR5711546.1 hypothetical protein [Nesterenkonia flava]